MKLPYGYVLIDGEITVQEEKAMWSAASSVLISPEPAWASGSARSKRDSLSDGKSQVDKSGCG